MTLTLLAIIVAAGLLGPIIAWSKKAHIPVEIGEMLAGIIIGATGFHLVNTHNSIFTFLGNIGFAMVMLVAGSHVPVRDKSLIHGIPRALSRIFAIVVVSIVLALIVTKIFDVGHAAIYAVIFASSSTAIIMPIIQGGGLAGQAVTDLIPQVALADAASVIAVPLVIDEKNTLHAVLGVAAIIGVSVLLFFILWFIQKQGWDEKVRERSMEANFALDLRVSLLLLFLLAALAQATQVSIMLAGFCLGIVIAGLGEPRRLASQLFALSDGFFSPLFFVWLGASINLGNLASHPEMILLAVVIALAAILAHIVTVFFKQPWPLAVIAASENGVPAAIVALGVTMNILKPGEGAAMILASLLTVVAAVIAGRIQLARQGTAAGTADTASPALTESDSK